MHTMSPSDDVPAAKKIIPTLSFIVIVFAMFFSIMNIKTSLDKSNTSDPPQFRIDSISIDSFNVSNLESSSSWKASIYVRNPNNHSRYVFESMQASVAYKKVQVEDLPLADAGFPNFKLYTHESRSVEVVMAPNYNYLHDASNLDLDHLMDSLALDYGTNATVVDLTVVVKGTIFIDWLFLDKGTRSPLEVHCEGLKVGFKSNNYTAGTMLGEPRDCKVHLKFHFWKWSFTNWSTS